MHMGVVNRIAELRNLKGWSQEDLARRVGTTNQQIGRLEKGDRELTLTWMQKLAPALEAEIADLLPTAPRRVVPLVGYVGAGYQIFPIDDHAKGGGLDEVEIPPGWSSASTVAVKVRGDSMLPVYADGDVIYYDQQENGDLNHLIGRECVVRTLDERCFVKRLHRGTSPRRWTLISYSGPPIEVEIEWAARVKWVLKA